MKNNQVSLKDLLSDLDHTHVVLDLDFLEVLLRNASKSYTPDKNEDFASSIDCSFNKHVGKAIGIYQWKRGKRTIPFSKLRKIVELSDYSWIDIERYVLSIKSGIRLGEVVINFPLLIDENLGAIIGYVLGDGSIDKRYNQVFFSNSNKELLKDFIYRMEIIFNIKPRMWVQKINNFEEKTKWIRRVYNLDDVPENSNVGLFYPTICGRILHSICGKFADGKKKMITEEIKNSNKHVLKYLVRAFFDSEGSAYNHRNMVRVYQDDKQLLEDLREIMLDFGIKSNKVRYYMKRGKRRHSFDITNKENFIRFHKEIGFLSSKKRLNSI